MQPWLCWGMFLLVQLALGFLLWRHVRFCPMSYLHLVIILWFLSLSTFILFIPFIDLCVLNHPYISAIKQLDDVGWSFDLYVYLVGKCFYENFWNPLHPVNWAVVLLLFLCLYLALVLELYWLHRRSFDWLLMFLISGITWKVFVVV